MIAISLISRDGMNQNQIRPLNKIIQENDTIIAISPDMLTKTNLLIIHDSIQVKHIDSLNIQLSKSNSTIFNYEKVIKMDKLEVKVLNETIYSLNQRNAKLEKKLKWKNIKCYTLGGIAITTIIMLIL